MQAIFEAPDVPGEEELFIATNADFFGPEVTGWGAPGGVAPDYVSKLDTKLVRDFIVEPK